MTGAAILVAFALMAEPNPYTDRLHARGETSRSDPVVAEARRIEAAMRARVRFDADPNTAAVRIVIFGKDRRVSIDAFRRSATSWTVEQIELVPADGDYDRGTPIAARSEPSSQMTYALEDLLGRPSWSGDCRSATQTVVIVHDAFLGVDHVFKGCPGGAAAAMVRLLDGDAIGGAD